MEREWIEPVYRAYWGLALAAGGATIGVTVFALSRLQAQHLRRLLLLEFAFLFTMTSTFLTELGRGGPEAYDQVTWIGGLMGVSLLVVTLPRYVNGRPGQVLLPGADKLFFLIGTGLFLHCIVSSAVHFAGRYALGIPYFDGHRVFPVFVTFFALAAADTYLAIAFIVARPTGELSRKEKRVLTRFGLSSFAFVPVMLVFDNLRWLFPRLWALYPLERFFVLPLFYIYLNVTIALAISAGRRRKEPPRLGSELGFTRRESEVARLILAGRSYRQTADQLCVSLSTVQSHVSSIYGKAGVNTNKIQLANRLREAT